MFANNVSKAGFLIAVIGWLLLLFMPGDARLGIVNFHAMALFQNAIYFGYALIIAGALGWGVEQLKGEFADVKILLKGNPDMLAAWEVNERDVHAAVAAKAAAAKAAAEKAGGSDYWGRPLKK
ncbi:MAG: hypothetical protein Q8J92_02795 [Parvibaculum sp.]|nr:hypothetical protein [Parvibaculum sp.]MDZ4369069.1 hypothetical protein [Afipia sp.]